MVSDHNPLSVKPLLYKQRVVSLSPIVDTLLWMLVALFDLCCLSLDKQNKKSPDTRHY